MWYNFVIELLLRTSIFALFSVIVDPYHFLNLLFHFPPSVQSVMWWRAANSAGGVPASEWPEVERAQLWHARQTSRCGAVQHAAMPWQRFLAQATMEAGTIVFLFLLHSSVSLSRCHVLLFTVLSFCTMKSVIFFLSSGIMSVEAKIAVHSAGFLSLLSHDSVQLWFVVVIKM